jgi:ribosomal subunit interface protein
MKRCPERVVVSATGGQFMSFRVSGKNIEIGEALRERISGRILESVEKYFDGGGFSGHATVGKEAFGFRTECVLHLDSGVVMRADSMAADANLSADQATDRLDKQLRRYHRKLKDYHGNARDGADQDQSVETPGRPPR